MGRGIERLLLERGHEVVLLVDETNREELTPDNLRRLGVEVALEFTTPDTAFENIMTCLEAGIGVVCGTTGWLDRYDEAVALCLERGAAFFYAPNFSIGVNVMFRLNRMLARMMNAFSEYDVTLEEVHHTGKKDAPSGTAIELARGITDNLGRKERWVGATTTEPAELEVLSVRRGAVPGIHTVTYESESDSITLTHSARDRQGLVSGAVAAAEFIRGRKGVFSMDDMLGREE